MGEETPLNDKESICTRMGAQQVRPIPRRRVIRDFAYEQGLRQQECKLASQAIFVP